jgi:hypothetical protein
MGFAVAAKAVHSIGLGINLHAWGFVFVEGATDSVVLVGG